MTDDPDKREDILGLGDSDCAPRAFRLVTRLDRVTLRLTRRPRLMAIAAGLAVAALVAGAVAYLGPGRAGVPASAAQPRPVASHCTVSGPAGLTKTEIAKLLKQMPKQTLKSPSGGQVTYIVAGVNDKTTVKVSC
ncbi:MAG TPA: hypothetical protein VGG16_12970 [Streptosporangiaceae bacterium]